jgi:hypothetical protein
LKEEEDKVEDEEEEEGAYGSRSPIQWDNLADEDELAGGGSSSQAMGPFLYHEGGGHAPGADGDGSPCVVRAFRVEGGLEAAMCR